MIYRTPWLYWPNLNVHCILNQKKFNFENLSKAIFLICFAFTFQIREGMHTQKYFVQWTYLYLEKLSHAIRFVLFNKKIFFI